MVHKDKEFHTPDTALAAYLVISGIELIKLDTDSFPAEYIFSESTNGTISKLITQWEKGNTDCVRFYRQYKQFITQIKGSRRA